MAGPTPMALGGFAFQALGFSFDGQARKVDTSWAEINVTARLDVLQWVGPKSDAFTITGAIFDESFGGQDSLDGIRAAAMAGTPMMLVTRAGRVMGLHVIMGIDEDRTFIKASGQARKNAYSISLRRYSGGGLAGGLAGLTSLFR